MPVFVGLPAAAGLPRCGSCGRDSWEGLGVLPSYPWGMPRIRVAAAQLNTVVGDLAGNVSLIVDAYEAAVSAGADLVVFPELTVTGYPPEDLLLRPAFVAE